MAEIKDFPPYMHRMADEIDMILTPREIRAEAGLKEIDEGNQDIIFSKEELKALMAQEKELTVELEGKSLNYRDVWLVDGRFMWLPAEGKKRTLEYTWARMVLRFYFPSKEHIRLVKIEECLPAFTKPQISIIIGWVRTAALRMGYDLT